MAKLNDRARGSRTIGIDPGITGAFVVIDENGEITRSVRTPILVLDGKKQYDINGMRDLVFRVRREVEDNGFLQAGIEKVHTLPSDGRVGAFRFGVGYGLWLGILSGSFAPYVEVLPQRWQAKMLAGLPRGPQTKMSAVMAAKSLFPHIPIEHKADWGMADAALIAEFVRRERAGDRI